MRIVIGGVRGIPARYGGFETSVEETARRMEKLGHHVTVYCRSRGIEPDLSDYAGIKLVYLRVFGPKFLETIVHSIAIGIHLAFRDRDVDVVHLYNAASAFGGFFVRLARKPLIMTLDGVEWKRKKWNQMARVVWKAATWLAMRVANIVVCDSQIVGTLFEEQYSTKIRHIPYGGKQIGSVSNAYKGFGLEHKQYFIFVGRLVPEKGVDALLDAYNILSSDIPLIIVGGNEDDPEYVASLYQRAGSNVQFLGYRYGEEYESLLANARAYISASKLEGTSPSLLAAMAAQVCCLVNSIPENRETGGDSVIYFDGSASDLAKQWSLFVESPEIINEYACKGWERVRAHYDWDVVTSQYLAAYAEISDPLPNGNPRAAQG